MRRPSCRTVAAAAVAATLLLTAPGTAAASGPVHLRGTAYEFNNAEVRLAARRSAWRSTRGSARGRARRHLRPRGARPRDRSRPTSSPPGTTRSISRRSRPPARISPGQLPDAIGRASTARWRRCSGSAGRGGRPARVRDRVDVQHAQRPRPRASAVHRLRGARPRRRDRVGHPGAAGADVLQRERRTRPGPAALLRGRRGDLDRRPRRRLQDRARHPSTRFASFVATCRPGRVVNANPPWGCMSSGCGNPARITAAWGPSTDHASRCAR